MMKVLLVANYKPDRQNSMARYARLLHSELTKRGYGAEIIHPPIVATRVVGSRNPLWRWLGYLDKYVLFPPLLWMRARRADVVHICDHSNSAYLRWTGKTPTLITAHDALAIRSALGHFPQNTTRWSGVRLQRWILRGLADANRITCVSEKTRQDFELLLGSGPKMGVIPDALGSAFYPATQEEVAAVRKICGLGREDEYLLHVGKGTWYKNRPGLLAIVSELRKRPRFAHMKLLIAGGPLSVELRESARGLEILEFTGPTDDELRALYTGALALLLPSLEEGFGWPIIEAQACGCPVITTARAPMDEVAGGAAILIHPEDVEGAATEIAARIHEAPELRRAGLANVRRYSADVIVERYCRVYEEMVSAGRSAPAAV